MLKALALISALSASLTACIHLQETTIPTMEQFPAPVASAELEAAQPAIRRAFAEAHPGLEVVKLEPKEAHWHIARAEMTGVVLRRAAQYNLEFRRGGRCFYAVSLIYEEHVDAAWEPPQIVDFMDLYRAVGNVQTEKVDHINAAPLPCDGVASVAATPP